MVIWFPFYELSDYRRPSRLGNMQHSSSGFCSQTEEAILENLTPGTPIPVPMYEALNVAGTGKWSESDKFATMPAVPGLALDPSPVIAIVRRHRKPQKKTVFLPAS
uniref:Uncharacterized protein n=1 Tax=Sphaerodactylus townsendi TaxID=933632 RepID=A0ACB8FS93_9SAUR